MRAFWQDCIVLTWNRSEVTGKKGLNFTHGTCFSMLHYNPYFSFPLEQNTMHWYSTVESTNKLEFSVLAVIESLVAVFLSLYLAWELKIVFHIIIAACLAPFLLLHTEKSARQGLRYFKWMLEKSIPIYRLGFRKNVGWVFMVIGVFIITIISFIFFSIEPTLWVSFIILIYILFVYVFNRQSLVAQQSLIPRLAFWVGVSGGEVLGYVLNSLISKLAATIQTIILSPLVSLKAIPANWFRVVFCIDSLHPPELMPGIEKHPGLSSFNFKTKVLKLKSRQEKSLGNHNAFLWFLIHSLFTFMLFIPALAYRWSLKSSSIIWLPLIWIIGWEQKKARDNNTQLQINLDALRYTAWAKITAAFAFIVIFVLTLLPFVLKAQIYSYQENVSILFNDQLINNIFNFFFAVNMEAWHWSRLAVAILTLTTFFYADKLLRKRKFSPEAGLNFAPLFLRFVTFLRVPLSLFTIACGFWLLLSPINWQAEFQQLDWLPAGLPNFLKSLISIEE